NASQQTSQFNGIINYFITDRNNRLVIQDELIVNDNNNNTSLSNNKTIANSQDEPIKIRLNSSQISEFIPGPYKLKLIITTMDSPKPLIHENTLIARPS
ncbi:MAG TPA: hypothetical protein VEQ18_02550, partial [Candidatus Nitrosocosmicus sp.]|nr:hypothetical protein [Candidatus Nitrosocosmicus sp.]